VTQKNFENWRGRPRRKGIGSSDENRLPNGRTHDNNATKSMKNKLPQVGKRTENLQKEDRI
jgi:hypothetical protein